MDSRIGSLSQTPTPSSEGDSPRPPKRQRVASPVRPSLSSTPKSTTSQEKDSDFFLDSPELPPSPAPELTYGLEDDKASKDTSQKDVDLLEIMLEEQGKQTSLEVLSTTSQEKDSDFFPNSPELPPSPAPELSYGLEDDKASKDTSQKDVDLLEIMLEEQGKQTVLSIPSETTASQKKDSYPAYGYQASTSYAPPNITQEPITVDEYPISILHLNESPVGGHGLLDTSHPFIESENNMDLASQGFKIYERFNQETSSPTLPSEENTQSPSLTAQKWFDRAGLKHKRTNLKNGHSSLRFDEFIALVIAYKFKKNITDLTEDEKKTPISNIKKDIDTTLEYLKEKKYIKGHKNYNEFVTHIFDDDYQDIYRNIDILREMSPYFSLHFLNKNKNKNNNEIDIKYNALYNAKLNPNLPPEKLEGLFKTQEKNYDEATFEEIKGKLKLIEDAKRSYKKSSTPQESENLVSHPLTLNSYIKIMIPLHKILSEYQEDDRDNKIYLENIDIENDKNKKIIRHVKNILKFSNIYLTQKVNSKVDTMLKNNTEFKKAIQNIKFKEKNSSDTPLNIKTNILEIFKDMERDYDEKEPLFDNLKTWCEQAGLKKTETNIITRAQYKTHPLNIKKTLALAVTYYKNFMESVEKAGSTSCNPLEIQEKDISHISISDAKMEKAIGLMHIELIKKHKVYFSDKHDKILKNILKYKDIYTIYNLRKINKYYKSAQSLYKDARIDTKSLIRKKQDIQLSTTNFLKLMIPICRIFIPNAGYKTLSNEDFFKKLSSNKSEYSAILETVIPLTRDILKDFYDVNTDYLDNDIKNYLA